VVQPFGFHGVGGMMSLVVWLLVVYVSIGLSVLQCADQVLLVGG